jgi:hypothetical protein
MDIRAATIDSAWTGYAQQLQGQLQPNFLSIKTQWQYTSNSLLKIGGASALTGTIVTVTALSSTLSAIAALVSAISLCVGIAMRCRTRFSHDADAVVARGKEICAELQGSALPPYSQICIRYKGELSETGPVNLKVLNHILCRELLSETMTFTEWYHKHGEMSYHVLLQNEDSAARLKDLFCTDMEAGKLHIADHASLIRSLKIEDPVLRYLQGRSQEGDFASFLREQTVEVFSFIPEGERLSFKEAFLKMPYVVMTSEEFHTMRRALSITSEDLERQIAEDIERLSYDEFDAYHGISAIMDLVGPADLFKKKVLESMILKELTSSPGEAALRIPPKEIYPLVCVKELESARGFSNFIEKFGLESLQYLNRDQLKMLFLKFHQEFAGMHPQAVIDDWQSEYEYLGYKTAYDYMKKRWDTWRFLVSVAFHESGELPGKQPLEEKDYVELRVLARAVENGHLRAEEFKAKVEREAKHLPVKLVLELNLIGLGLVGSASREDVSRIPERLKEIGRLSDLIKEYSWGVFESRILSIESRGVQRLVDAHMKAMTVVDFMESGDVERMSQFGLLRLTESEGLIGIRGEYLKKCRSRDEAIADIERIKNERIQKQVDGFRLVEEEKKALVRRTEAALAEPQKGDALHQALIQGRANALQNYQGVIDEEAIAIRLIEEECRQAVDIEKARHQSFLNALNRRLQSELEAQRKGGRSKV